MPVELWATAAFHAEARSWAARAARSAGFTLSGESHQPHNKPWSTAIRFQSDAGPLWFKANGPGTLHEGTLVATLSRLEPALVPEVIAVDRIRGWWLMRDGGPILRSLASPDELWSRWESILPRYAEAQIRLSSHGRDLLATGLPEETPETLPGQFESLLEDLRQRPSADGGIAADEASALEAHLQIYRERCAELATSGLPSTIQHDDLHSSNICWHNSARAFRIVDWGDASWGHPLGTMLSTLNSIAHHAKTPRDDPRVQRVRDAFLEPFTTLAPLATLQHLVTVARQVGCVTRALSYVHAFEGEPIAAEAAEDFPVRGWLLELLEG
jgi:hypothetical protein